MSEEIEAGRFRDQMFLHSVASQNPKLYFELYDEPDVPEEFEIPRSLEDLQRMMAELSEVGVDLDASEPPPQDHGNSSYGELEQRYGVRPATQPWNV